MLTVTLAILVATGVVDEEVARAVTAEMGDKPVPRTFDECLAQVRRALARQF